VHIAVVGLSHHTAPIDIRERLSFSPAAIPDALKELRSLGVPEVAILSTCNRTEVYAALEQREHADRLSAFLVRCQRPHQTDISSHLYTLHDQQAARHLMRVACGLDSQVLGESQILHQVRTALQIAKENATALHLLSSLFRAAIVAGRRARAETRIGLGSLSIGHAAVELARSIFGHLDGVSLLLLGAGEMSELTAKHLVANGAQFVMVANRTYQKAVCLAQKLSGQAIRYESLPEAMLQSDVIISSTSSPHLILRRETLCPIVEKRNGRPLFMIDIAVPRDIEPSAGALPGVFLYDIDDLQGITLTTARERAEEVPRVEALIEEELSRFAVWRNVQHINPFALEIRSRFEEIRCLELKRLRSQLPNITENEWRKIEAATRSMMNRVAQIPIQNLKRQMIRSHAERKEILDSARSLFEIAPADACDDEQGRQPTSAPSLYSPPYADGNAPPPAKREERVQ
jgi:glutamyl-tRNA reductase